MRVSVIISTFERPRELELVLAGYALQDDPDFEVVVADDGSGFTTAAVIAAAARRSALWHGMHHVWHPDHGFCKNEILDRAICESEGEYLLFTDGDCIPRPDFVSTHRRLATEGSFLSGGCVRLSSSLSEALGPRDVSDGWIWDASELARRGPVARRAALRMLWPGLVPRLLDVVTPTRATFNGGNSSAWKEAVIAVNGFELGLGYGGEDREFGRRLENLGVRGRQVRHRAVLLHLDHDRPYRDPAIEARQRVLRNDLARSGRARAVRGISELAVQSTTPPWESR